MWDEMAKGLTTLVHAGWVDILTFIILVFGILSGFKSGFVSQVICLASTVVGIRLAYGSAPMVAELITPLYPESYNVRIVMSFVGIYISVIIVCRIIVALWRNVKEGTTVGVMDAIGGAMFSFIRVIFIAAIAIYMLSLLPFKGVKQPVCASLLYKYTCPITKEAWKKVPQLKTYISNSQRPEVDI